MIPPKSSLLKRNKNLYLSDFLLLWLYIKMLISLPLLCLVVCKAGYLQTEQNEHTD